MEHHGTPWNTHMHHNHMRRRTTTPIPRNPACPRRPNACNAPTTELDTVPGRARVAPHQSTQLITGRRQQLLRRDHNTAVPWAGSAETPRTDPPTGSGEAWPKASREAKTRGMEPRAPPLSTSCVSELASRRPAAAAAAATWVAGFDTASAAGIVVYAVSPTRPALFPRNAHPDVGVQMLHAT